jgi:hypothetical protein
VWKAITEFANKLADKPAIFLMLAGVIFIGLGLAGGVTYHGWFPIAENNSYGAIAIGIALLIWGGVIANRKPVPPIKGYEYGVKIINPSEREQVDIVSVKGTIEKMPPEGYKLMVLRIYPNARYGIHPLKEVTFTGNKAWHADDCDVGGKTNDPRTIGAYLVGPSGQALFRYYSEAANQHYELRHAKDFKFLPLIYERTPDMVKCAEVGVRRK